MIRMGPTLAGWVYQARRLQVFYQGQLTELTRGLLQRRWEDALEAREVLWKMITPSMELECVEELNGKRFWIPAECRKEYPVTLTSAMKHALVQQGVPVQALASNTLGLTSEERLQEDPIRQWLEALIQAYLLLVFAEKGERTLLVASYPILLVWETPTEKGPSLQGRLYGTVGWAHESIWPIREVPENGAQHGESPQSGGSQS